ncbi:MAG: DUF1178 family protein [Amphiplicatus sp.]
MMKYQLRCDAEHQFEGWFRSSGDYDAQAEAGLLSCPVCGTDAVQKAIMAPAIAKGDAGRAERLNGIRQSVTEAAARARADVEKNFDYVGDKFPDEARRIHYGETDQRRIYGEATGEEVKELVQEGVEIAPLPASPKPETAPDRAGKARISARAKKTLN